MTNHRWNYCGDINLEHGGYFWREAGADDYVEAVDVAPCSDAGGPDNLFWITEGSIYLGGDRAGALSCIGAEPGTTDRATLVDAHRAYGGVESDSLGASVVRIGPAEPIRGQGWDNNITGDVVLRASASLTRYVRKECLGLSR